MKTGSPIRLLLTEPYSFGPGKAELLREIERTGSLRGAVSSMCMSYNKAWTMITRMNVTYAKPLVIFSRGGKSQCGAELTGSGREILSIYDEAVAFAEAAEAVPIEQMSVLLAGDESKSS